ncbi:MAG: hypothetical protein Q4G09_00185 [Clostridia bacterium]|nr:hypothetical protein [Clostridia bacterium]
MSKENKFVKRIIEQYKDYLKDEDIELLMNHKNASVLTEDMLTYYNIELNSENAAGLIFLINKYDKNSFFKNLLEYKILYLSLKNKNYQEKYYKYCSIFVEYYQIDSSMQIKIDEMAKIKNRNEFRKQNEKLIFFCEDEYKKKIEEIRELYKQSKEQLNYQEESL